MSQLIHFLKEAKYLDSLIFKICIVGSRKMSSQDDYGSGIWNIFAPNLMIYGFDADEDSCVEANENIKQRHLNWQEQHFPFVIAGEKGSRNLYVTKGLDCTSLYLPNEPFLNRLAAFDHHIKLDFIIEVETITLDDFCRDERIEDIDFLYIDVQGAELDVLKGADFLLKKSILGMQLEVEFSPLYQNQPLFADVDKFLKNYQFALFDLITEHPMNRRPRSISPIYSEQKKGQLLWADALYFKDPLSVEALELNYNPQQVFKLACIADIFDYPDYAIELLTFLTTNYGQQEKYNFNSILNKTYDYYQSNHS